MYTHTYIYTHTHVFVFVEVYIHMRTYVPCCPSSATPQQSRAPPPSITLNRRRFRVFELRSLGFVVQGFGFIEACHLPRSSWVLLVVSRTFQVQALRVVLGLELFSPPLFLWLPVSFTIITLNPKPIQRTGQPPALSLQT